MGTGEVSRYKVSRSQKSVTMHDFNWQQMRVSGCKNHYKSILGAGAKVEDPPTGGDETPPWRGKNRENLFRFFRKSGMARVFAVRVLSRLSITSVAVQVILRMGNYPDIVILLTVVARSGFVKHYDSV
jgi:hypothetical protein